MDGEGREGKGEGGEGERGRGGEGRTFNERGQVGEVCFVFTAEVGEGVMCLGGALGEL